MGDSASLSRTVTKDDITLFATVSGDVNPRISIPNSPRRTCSTM
jgi:hypothetical protein